MADRQPGIHSEEVKARLRIKFGPITHLARQWGYGRTAISDVLRHPSYSVPLERRIAEALGLHPHDIWPDRYSADGEALPRRRCPRSTPQASPETSQKRRAA